MKKQGMLNREIAAVLARMGHTDQLVIADCGLPIPDNVTCIDVSIRQGVPDFLTVLQAVLDDMQIEAITLAEEIRDQNPLLQQHVIDETGDIPLSYISHEALKERIIDAKAVIRTGENTPFANAILQSGVIF